MKLTRRFLKLSFYSDAWKRKQDYLQKTSTILSSVNNYHKDWYRYIDIRCNLC